MLADSVVLLLYHALEIKIKYKLGGYTFQGQSIFICKNRLTVFLASCTDLSSLALDLFSDGSDFTINGVSSSTVSQTFCVTFKDPIIIFQGLLIS